MGVGRTKCTWPLWHHSVGRSRPGWTLRREGGQGGGGLQGGGGQLDNKEMVDKVYMAVKTVVFSKNLAML